MNVLVTCDLRLGRQITGLPAHVDLDGARRSHTAAWDRLVDLAVRRSVDALILLGDTIDPHNDAFEPVHPLRLGLAQLERADISAYAVCDDIQDERLSRILVSTNNRNLQLHNPNNPLTIGSHTINVIENSADADLTLVDDSISWDDGSTFSPGSPVPTHPTTNELHAALLLHVHGEQITAERIGISPVQFTHVEIDCSGARHLDEIERDVIDALQHATQEAIDAIGERWLDIVVCTLTLSGRSALHSALPDFVDELTRTLDIDLDGVRAVIGDVRVRTQPDIDLESLRERPDPAGEIARLILALDPGAERTESQSRLIQQATDRAATVGHSRVFAAIASDPSPDEPTVIDSLRQESWNVLDALIRQRGRD